MKRRVVQLWNTNSIFVQGYLFGERGHSRDPPKPIIRVPAIAPIMTVIPEGLAAARANPPKIVLSHKIPTRMAASPGNRGAIVGDRARTFLDASAAVLTQTPRWGNPSSQADSSSPPSSRGYPASRPL